MESFNHNMGEENPPQRGNFPQYLTSAMIAQDSHHQHQHHHMDMKMNMSMSPLAYHLHQPTANYFHSPSAEYQNQNQNHNQQGSNSNSSVKSEGDRGAHKQAGSAVPLMFHYSSVMTRKEQQQPHEKRNDHVLGMGRNTNVVNLESTGEVTEAMKAKIINHPHYSNLLQAYMECQKVGAPPDVSARLSAMMEEYETRQRSLVAVPGDASNDPELDQFMEAYCDMLEKYREEITRPVEEAMEFMHKIESQLNILTNGRARILNSDETSEEDEENSIGETEITEIDPRAEDRELKNHLLKKYSGYLSSLKQELSKKKKKGKLPKEARQKLLSWWELHYKWPYPSESEKIGLAEATGLDQKQINNWFINQRKRHWKPSEDMQLMVMDGLHPSHNSAALYMDAHYLPHAPYRFGT